MTYTMARPNKFMDAAKLEEFTKTEHPITFENLRNKNFLRVFIYLFRYYSRR